MSQIVEEDDDKGLGKKSANAVSGHRLFINNIGYRGPNFTPRKPPGVTRIVIVGGSAVFDANARDPNANETRDWPHLVERLLKNQGYNNIEVINAGIPGHASFDSLGRLYSQLWIYEPDYVLLYNVWNDIKYFTKLTPEHPLIDEYGPYPGSNPFIEYQGFWDRLFANSQLYVKLRNHYYGWKFEVGEEGAVPQRRTQDTYGSYGIRQYRLDVELFVDAAKDIGAEPILITEATLVSPTNSTEERKLIPYKYVSLTPTALVRAFDEAYETLRLVAREKKVPLLDLTKEVNGKRALFTDTVHLTTEGSEKVASLVAGFLATNLKEQSNSKKTTKFTEIHRNPYNHPPRPG